VAALVREATREEPHVNHPALQVAAGDYELALFFLAGPWDIAAPALIVEEAGGRFTDLGGHPELTSGTALFSNGHIHDAVLRFVTSQHSR
jgi:fructose-1,6-bisphosphatase/inositol monophosphatase family enzyme